MMKRKSKPSKNLHTFIYHLGFLNTGLDVKIKAQDDAGAYEKVKKMLTRLEGGQGCRSIRLLKVR